MEIYYSLVKMQPLALLAVIGWHLCILLFLFKRFLFICISFLFTIRLITFHQHIFSSFSSSSSFTTHNINQPKAYNKQFKWYVMAKYHISGPFHSLSNRYFQIISFTTYPVAIGAAFWCLSPQRLQQLQVLCLLDNVTAISELTLNPRSIGVCGQKQEVTAAFIVYASTNLILLQYVLHETLSRFNGNSKDIVLSTSIQCLYLCAYTVQIYMYMNYPAYHYCLFSFYFLLSIYHILLFVLLFSALLKLLLINI